MPVTIIPLVIGTGTNTGTAENLYPTFNKIASNTSALAAAVNALEGVPAALDAKAPKESPQLTGMPIAPTAAVGTITDQIATTAFVAGSVSSVASREIRPGTTPDYLGVNLSGLEFGTGNIANTNYLVPTPALVDAWANRGVTAIRLPFKWDRLQRSAGGALNDEYAGFIDAVVQQCGKRGVACVLDAHDYASGPASWASGKWGAGDGPTSAQFADLWGKIATKWGNAPHVIFGLQNEPSVTEALITTYCNAAITAIRATGSNHFLLIPAPGASASTLLFSTTREAFLTSIVDSKKRWALEIHQYTDTNGSGGANSGTGDNVVTVERLTEILIAASEFGERMGVKLWLGEFGGGAGANPVASISSALAFMQTRPNTWLGATAWGAGVGWGDTYPNKLEPLADGLERPQTQALMAYGSFGMSRRVVKPVRVHVPNLTSGTFTKIREVTVLTNPGAVPPYFIGNGAVKEITVRARARLPASATTTTNGRAILINGSLFLGVNSTGRAKAAYGGSSTMQHTAGPDLRDGKWHEFHMTASPSGGSLHIDGVQVATTAVDFTTQATNVLQFSINLGRKQTDINEDGSFGSVGAFWPGDLAWAEVWMRSFLPADYPTDDNRLGVRYLCEGTAAGSNDPNGRAFIPMKNNVLSTVEWVLAGAPA